MESPTRRRFESAKPEAGLTEWTNKIKALQRDVDADEEAEQRKLEEEIRASRLARSRRSGGGQFATRFPAPALSERDEEDDSTPVHVSSKLNDEQPTSVLMERSTSKPEPMSLAAFIGGRATGPRLNRPAAQPDTHDPTLFEQRTRADIVAPHPIFGSGGVALAGLTSKGHEVVKAEENEAFDNDAPVQSAHTMTVPKRAPSPEPLPRIEEPRNAAPITNATPARSWARERTVSTPSPFVQSKPVERSSPIVLSGSPGVRGRVESLFANAHRPSTVKPKKSIESIVQKPVTPTKPDTLRTYAARESPRRILQSASHPSSSPSPSSPPQRAVTSPPISFPSLARPVQPQPRPASDGPQIPLSKTPAPAFLKPTVQKDPTPSLSRLKGRGFVQSVVKLSSEMEASTGSSPDRTTSPKKMAVLERWNPQQNESPSSPSPVNLPVAAPPMRKSKTIDTPSYSVAPETPPEPIKRPKSAHKAHSHPEPSKPTPTKGKHVPGDALPLGSSTTTISYIKTNKTGDAPPTDSNEEIVSGPKTPGDEKRRRTHSRPRTPSKHHDNDKPDMDELGMRPRKSKSGPSSPSKNTKSDLTSVSSGRPLSHPTKGRAKVRRKNVGGQKTSSSTKITTPEERSTPILVVDTKTAIEARAPISPVPLSSITSTAGDRTSHAPARGEKIRQLQNAWSNQAPIGVKPLRKPSQPSPLTSTFAPALSSVRSNKQALPGLADINTTISPPSPPLTPPLTVRNESRPPTSPARHNRIPSSGSRPTVMDVAQTFANNPTSNPVSPVSAFPKSPVAATSPQIYAPSPSAYNPADPGGWGESEESYERTITPAMLKAERRRSNYEKYSNFTLPVVKEEKTPVGSPVGTLKKEDIVNVNTEVSVGEKEGVNEVKKERPVPAKKPDFARASKVHIDIIDEPLPAVSASKIWGSSRPSCTFVANQDSHTISVEVFCVDGPNTTEITKGKKDGMMFVFYDEETYVIVHRAKSRSSGLVDTKVWVWRGQKVVKDELGEVKVKEFGKRYNTSLVEREQDDEPQELVHILGGSLVVRQGKRSLWTSENSTMHCIRSTAGLIFVDEVELETKNLCSGFSYCISLLDTIWVWYGCGSLPSERSAALRYAEGLLSDAPDSVQDQHNDETDEGKKKIVELEEGQEDELFWMFLGEDGYAHADYWKWRKDAVDDDSDPRIWKIDCSKANSEIKELECLPSAKEIVDSVLVIHLAYEIFTLVGAGARGSRKNIRLGLNLSQGLSSHTARSKPFRPPVHILIFPTQIPLDLRAALRGLESKTRTMTVRPPSESDSESGLNETPNHMNLLTLEEAWAQINRKEWEPKVEDSSMMPLGFDPRASPLPTLTSTTSS